MRYAQVEGRERDARAHRGPRWLLPAFAATAAGWVLALAPPTLAADGTTTTAIGPGFVSDFGADLAVQGDNKIVAVGTTQTTGPSGTDFAIARYNANGTLDPTFDGNTGNGNGVVTTSVGPASLADVANAVAIQSNGKIVVAGQANMGNTATGIDIAVVRYNANGTLDTSFDGDGKTTTDIAPGNDDDSAWAVAVYLASEQATTSTWCG